MLEMTKLDEFVDEDHDDDEMRAQAVPAELDENESCDIIDNDWRAGACSRLRSPPWTMNIFFGARDGRKRRTRRGRRRIQGEPARGCEEDAYQSQAHAAEELGLRSRGHPKAKCDGYACNSSGW